MFISSLHKTKSLEQKFHVLLSFTIDRCRNKTSNERERRELRFKGKFSETKERFFTSSQEFPSSDMEKGINLRSSFLVDLDSKPMRT